MPSKTPPAPSSGSSSAFKHYALIIHTWLVRIVLFPLPDIPVIMRLRGALYGMGMKSCGANFQVAHNVVLNGLELLEIERDVYFAPGCVVMAGGPVRVGERTLFGPNCLVSSNNHRFNGTHFADGIVIGEVNIGKYCWVGGNCSVLMGTRVHPSSVVAAGAVTNKDYERGYVVIGGVPGKIVKDLEPAPKAASAQ